MIDVYITIFKMPSEDFFHLPGRSSRSFLNIHLFREYDEYDTPIEFFLKNRRPESVLFADYSWKLENIQLDLLEHGRY